MVPGPRSYVDPATELRAMAKGLTVVLGASPRSIRYSYLAVGRLLEKGVPVVAVGIREGSVHGVPIVPDIPGDVPIDTITLYLSSVHHAAWWSRVLSSGARRIIFNPGTEDPAFAQAAKDSGIEVVHGCTLVMLASGTY